MHLSASGRGIASGRPPLLAASPLITHPHPIKSPRPRHTFPSLTPPPCLYLRSVWVQCAVSLSPTPHPHPLPVELHTDPSSSQLICCAILTGPLLPPILKKKKEGPLSLGAGELCLCFSSVSCGSLQLMCHQQSQPLSHWCHGVSYCLRVYQASR